MNLLTNKKFDMVFRRSCAFIVLLICASFTDTTGTPDGAAGCDGGKTAVGGAHLQASETVSRTLEQAGIIVKLGTTIITEGKTALVPADVSYEIRVESPLRQFIGILIRVEAPTGVDTSGSLTPDNTNTHIAGVCGPAPVVGITHFNKDPKSFANGTLVFDNNYKGVILDITVVYAMRINDYAYGRILVDYFGSPTSAPVMPSPKTNRPTSRPTNLPITKVTNAPVLVPRNPTGRTRRPTRRPNRQPRTKKPTSKPTRSPRNMRPTFRPNRQPRTMKPTSKPTR